MSLAHAIKVIPRSKVSRHLASLFKTPRMQAIALDTNSPVQHLCDRIARAPLFTFTPSSFGDDPASETNFTAWWRLLALRNKADSHPMMEDMYLLHECYHLANMPYFHNEFSYAEWKDKMIMNEQEASFYSEAWIYHIHPELRKEFPKTKIWADSFTYEQFQRDMFLEFLELPRMAPNVEEQGRAAKFEKANDLWCTEYWSIAQQVENHMANFHRIWDKDDWENEDSVAREETSIREHLSFIKDNSERLSQLANVYNGKWRQL